LSDSVRLRLRSDVPVACQLSGGLDSSAVAVLAARQNGPGLPVFSACYNVKPFDEREFIQPTVDQIRARETFVFPEPADLPGTLPDMIRRFDEPVCTVTFFAHWQVMSEVRRQGFKVILNGHGADELAAGYYDHFLHHFGDLRRAGETALLDREVDAWLDYHGRFRHDQLEHYFGLLDRGVPYMKDYLKFFSSYEAALGPALGGVNGENDASMDIFDSLLANRLHRELRRETLPAVLKAEDRTTMAHSIESRLPFLDYRLVEYMFSIPNHLKIRRGLGKYIQRRALEGVLPETVRARKEKVGFNAPSEHWFRHELKDYFEDMVSNARLFERGLLDRDGFQRVWSDHRSGRTNHYQFLWQVINLEIWLQEYFG
jgi:asparagine synthase (glutamine-hydrolysing)